MNGVLTEDGQLAMPKELQDQLGLKPASVLELQSHAGTLVASHHLQAECWVWLGRIDEAFEELQCAYQDRERGFPSFPFLDFFWDPYKGDERFKTLLQKAGLAVRPKPGSAWAAGDTGALPPHGSSLERHMPR
jgi:hypothetical protein